MDGWHHTTVGLLEQEEEDARVSLAASVAVDTELSAGMGCGVPPGMVLVLLIAFQLRRGEVCTNKLAKTTQGRTATLKRCLVTLTGP